jgi:hypothetical protein
LHGRKLLPTSLKACKKATEGTENTEIKVRHGLVRRRRIYPPDVWRVEL